MRAELCNAFVLAAGEVLASELNVQAKRGQLKLERDAYITIDVTVLISLVGDIGGIMILGMNFDTAKAMLSRMLGQKIETFDELAQSGISELGNVISGRASMKLADLGIESSISVPTLIVGKGSCISTLNISRLIVPFETELGVLRLDLALRENLDNPGGV